MVGVGNLNPTLPDGLYPVVAQYGGFTIRELRGRKGSLNTSGGTLDRAYRVRGDADPLLCLDALLNGPVLINESNGLALRDIDWENPNPNGWDFNLFYDAKSPNVKTGTYNVSIDTTGETSLQTYGLAANNVFVATGETATDHGSALNVQGNEIKGIERAVPALKITVTAKIATEYVVRPMAYAKKVASLTGFTNQDPMFEIYDSGGNPTGTYEFEAGELLFVGASGAIVSQDPQISFTFLASPNLTAHTIGGITGVNKKGHELIWFEFRDDVDSGGSNRQTQRIVAAHVGKVYGEGDLRSLKIGVKPT